MNDQIDLYEFKVSLYPKMSNKKSVITKNVHIEAENQFIARRIVLEKFWLNGMYVLSITKVF